ncbi:lipopolysaccharide assembly protein LapB [Flavobacterium sp. UMI-01]|uniref:tetratricopeptide repeat protein n=1 Tax=Flavobacterium sp. UMI-01 TaxID=1441053 RepID=UPI001C7CAEEA|nr:hypothetical protein [Flavobacterium sp. UMI-01]GIZ07493.1 hypothetical protein FUMI01_02200 [Flavobacterium sp. UMI-01]
MKNFFYILTTIVIGFFSITCFGQKSAVYNNIETKNVLYYTVEEIVNLKFGGTKTRYTVSDLSLISKTDLGPNNIRIIRPIYKNENFNKKNYYIEVKNTAPDAGTSQNPTTITEIKIESKKIEIPENPQIEKESLALVINTLIKSEEPIKPPIHTPEKTTIKKTTTPLEVATPSTPEKNKPTREKVDHININIMDIYERVAEKGYQSIYMYKELANYFFFNKQMDKAAKWYDALFSMTTAVDPVVYYRYGTALQQTGQLIKGNEMLEKFYKLTE